MGKVILKKRTSLGVKELGGIEEEERLCREFLLVISIPPPFISQGHRVPC